MTAPPQRKVALRPGQHAAQWLVDYLIAVGGEARVREIVTAAAAAGIHRRTLQRACPVVGVSLVPGKYRWRLDDGRDRCPHCGGAL